MYEIQPNAPGLCLDSFSDWMEIKAIIFLTQDMRNFTCEVITVVDSVQLPECTVSRAENDSVKALWYLTLASLASTYYWLLLPTPQRPQVCVEWMRDLLFPDSVNLGSLRDVKIKVPKNVHCRMEQKKHLLSSIHERARSTSHEPILLRAQHNNMTFFINYSKQQ
jgi:hypothetical protein